MIFKPGLEPVSCMERTLAWTRLLHWADSPYTFNQFNTMLDVKKQSLNFLIFIIVFGFEEHIKNHLCPE